MVSIQRQPQTLASYSDITCFGAISETGIPKGYIEVKVKVLTPIIWLALFLGGPEWLSLHVVLASGYECCLYVVLLTAFLCHSTAALWESHQEVSNMWGQVPPPSKKFQTHIRGNLKNGGVNFADLVNLDYINLATSMKYKEDSFIVCD